MTFNSFAFCIFFPVVLLVYYALRHRAQNLWLLAASFFFYGWWDVRFLGLLVISILVDYSCARAIGSSSNPRGRRALLVLSLCVGLGILGTFKYLGFFAESAAAILTAFGFHPSVTTLNIILPAGISFYTFQTLSYVIDVYRGGQEPCRNLATFALFVSFFPPLVAGPIERARHLIPQLTRKRHVAWEDLREGALLILIGYVKKILIADNLAPIVDSRFTHPEAFGSLSLLLGTYLFYVQVYCDFSGYSDIARGSARFFGIDLIKNFDHPHLAGSILEFWRRWHISLYLWLRDYVFVPLARSWYGRHKAFRNLFLMALLSALWHGANSTFLVAGCLQGMAAGVERWFHEARISRRLEWSRGPLARAITVLVTFNIIAATFLLFRAPTLASAAHYLSCMFAGAPFDPEIVGAENLTPRRIVIVVLFVILEWLQIRKGDTSILEGHNWVFRGVCYAAMILAIVVLGPTSGTTPFIYFQF